jgi:hypothetical protein
MLQLNESINSERHEVATLTQDPRNLDAVDTRADYPSVAGHDDWTDLGQSLYAHWMS